MVKPHGGFTLIEMLFCVAIMIVLLALLVPALDRTIYNAELGKCAWNLGEIARGVAVYTRDFRREYPYRAAVLVSGGPAYMLGDATFDDRPAIARAFPINPLLNDPLGTQVDLEAPPAGPDIHAGLNLWFGVRFQGPGAGMGMIRLDDRLEWTDGTAPSLTHRLRWVATDLDVFDKPAATIQSSHPDHEGPLRYNTTGEYQPGATPGAAIYSRWDSGGTPESGAVDLHAAGDHGGVERYREVTRDDARMVRLPHRTDATDWPGSFARVPAR